MCYHCQRREVAVVTFCRCVPATARVVHSLSLLPLHGLALLVRKQRKHHCLRAYIAQRRSGTHSLTAHAVTAIAGVCGCRVLQLRWRCGSAPPRLVMTACLRALCPLHRLARSEEEGKANGSKRK
jgi:hypothetical protein